MFDALHGAHSCVADAIPLGDTAEGESRPSPQPVGAKIGAEKAGRGGCTPLKANTEASCDSPVGSACDGAHSRSLEELCQSPWTPVRRQAAIHGWSGKQLHEGAAQMGKAAGLKYTIVAVNPRFQSGVKGSETEV